MKISYRILLINFAIVVLILGSSAFAFYSVMYEVLTAQHSKYLLNSANNLAYRLRDVQQDWISSFLLYRTNNDPAYFTQEYYNTNPQNIDFILEESGNSVKISAVNKNVINVPGASFTLQDFLNENPLVIINSYKDKDGKVFYFGRVISGEFLTFLSKSINAEIAVISHGIPSELSNEVINQNFLRVLLEACDNLKDKQNFNVFTSTEGSTDLIAALYKSAQNNIPGHEVQFLVFNPIQEAAVLRGSIQTILIVIGSAGVILSLILTLLFTGKMRKHISLLTKATEISKDGKFLNKINLHSKDEFGQLANSFNGMIDQLEKHQASVNEYSEFITLLNQNPSLAEVSDAALKKIVKSCGFTAGALYSVYNEEISLTSSFGTKAGIMVRENNDFFYTVVKSKETFELVFDKEQPVISSGIYDISIKYLLIQPVIYNNKVIAILELGGIDKPAAQVKEYLENIQEQLAIGLTNAGAFVQLENFVAELKRLNEEYQKQNIQIKKQNETLTELHKELEEKASELAEQKEKAEESTKLKSQFLANVSHELRTPMNSVLGLTELILNDNTLEKKTRERIEVVYKNGKRLMNLINDILDLSKIEAGKFEVNLDDVALHDIITDAESAVMHLALQKTLNLNIESSVNTNTIITADKEKVTQVLINLLDNAIKFTDKGFVRLNISTEEGLLKFKVSDSGIGIAAKDLEYIFNEFRQVDGTASRKYNGTGLGLAICRQIAELLQGYISVESVPGKGSVFTFAVPYITTSEIKKLIKQNDAIPDNHQKNKKTILVIEDNPEIRYTIGQYLVSKNYEVVFSETGDEGLTTAKKLHPFAVTLNTGLQGTAVWDVIKALKSDPVTKDIAVIPLSLSNDKLFGYAFQAFDYLTAPLTSEKLSEVYKSIEKLAKDKIRNILVINSGDEPIPDEVFNNHEIKVDVISESKNTFEKIVDTLPDLIIINLMNSDQDGLSLLARIKSYRETKQIPAIITIPEKLSGDNAELLNDSIEKIVSKYKGHPLDMLKVIRDRIELHEITIHDGSSAKHNGGSNGSAGFHEIAEREFLGDVLIVDDDPDTLFTLNEIVKACSCRTILAKSGKECLSILDHKTPDLILLDIMMPEMDGFQTFNRIKKSKNSSSIPVFAVTAKAMAEDKEIILRHGFDDYISKPVNSGVIAFKIEKLLSKLNTV
jgi:signal transduction histidine kinase/DNA-binding response OmpR family regulator/HAMP domain-containing protein